MFAVVQQTFLEKKPGKKSADLHPRQGNLIQSNNFSAVNKNLSSLHKIRRRSAEKNSPIFQTRFF
jgi:hypothetical protein